MPAALSASVICSRSKASSCRKFDYLESGVLPEVPGNVSGKVEGTGVDGMPGIIIPAPPCMPGIIVPVPPCIPGIIIPPPLAPVSLAPSPDDPVLPVVADEGTGDKLLPALDVVGLPDIEVQAASDIAQARSRTRLDIKFS